VGGPSATGITGATQLAFHLGHPIDHAKAPVMFNRELAERSSPVALVPLDVAPADLAPTVDGLRRAANCVGLLVTMPHKRSIVGLCDELGPQAQLVGAVNAVRVHDGALIGDMFDGVGLVRSLGDAGIELAGARVLLVGCGGAGSAIAHALSEGRIASLSLSNRTPARAEELAVVVARAHRSVPVAVGPPVAAGHDVVINATRIGMAEDEPSPIQLGDADRCAVVDIVTGEQRSTLLREADRRGLTTSDGAAMLRGQMHEILAFWGARTARSGEPAP
jgi:shikimate dehydrogenase